MRSCCHPGCRGLQQVPFLSEENELKTRVPVLSMYFIVKQPHLHYHCIPRGESGLASEDIVLQSAEVRIGDD